MKILPAWLRRLASGAWMAVQAATPMLPVIVIAVGLGAVVVAAMQMQDRVVTMAAALHDQNARELQRIEDRLAVIEAMLPPKPLK